MKDYHYHVDIAYSSGTHREITHYISIHYIKTIRQIHPIRADKTFTNEHRKFFLCSEKEYRIPPFSVRCSPYQRTILFTFGVIERIKAPRAYAKRAIPTMVW